MVVHLQLRTWTLLFDIGKLLFIVCVGVNCWMVIPLAQEDKSISAILFLGFAELGVGNLQCSKLWWLRHGRGDVCALIRSPLIGSVSHQQAVGQCRGNCAECGVVRTGGNLPVCRQERREEHCNLLHLQPHLHLGKTTVKNTQFGKYTSHTYTQIT